MVDGNGAAGGQAHGKEGEADVIEAQEAGDGLGDLPGTRAAGGPELTHSSSMTEEHSHALLQKSLPQIPVEAIELDTTVRLRCVRAALRLGVGCPTKYAAHAHSCLAGNAMPLLCSTTAPRPCAGR